MIDTNNLALDMREKEDNFKHICNLLVHNNSKLKEFHKCYEEKTKLYTEADLNAIGHSLFPLNELLDKYFLMDSKEGVLFKQMHYKQLRDSIIVWSSYYYELFRTISDIEKQRSDRNILFLEKDQENWEKYVGSISVPKIKRKPLIEGLEIPHTSYEKNLSLFIKINLRENKIYKIGRKKFRPKARKMEVWKEFLTEVFNKIVDGRGNFSFIHKESPALKNTPEENILCDKIGSFFICLPFEEVKTFDDERIGRINEINHELRLAPYALEQINEWKIERRKHEKELEEAHQRYLASPEYQRLKKRREREERLNRWLEGGGFNDYMQDNIAHRGSGGLLDHDRSFW